MSDKKSIRDQILAQRTTISHEKRHAAGKIITWYLQQPPVNFLMHPGCFCIYLSMDNEIPIIGAKDAQRAQVLYESLLESHP